MNNLCKYSDIFGAPNTGAHSYRIFNLALVDLFATIFVAILTSLLFKINVIISLLIWFGLGIILHRLFCVNTTINKLIFGII